MSAYSSEACATAIRRSLRSFLPASSCVSSITPITLHSTRQPGKSGSSVRTRTSRRVAVFRLGRGHESEIIRKDHALGQDLRQAVHLLRRFVFELVAAAARGFNRDADCERFGGRRSFRRIRRLAFHDVFILRAWPSPPTPAGEGRLRWRRLFF